MNKLDKQYTDLIGESYKNYLTMTEPTFIGKNISLPEFIHWVKTDEKYSEKWGLKIEERELSPKERIGLAGGKIQDKYPALVEMSLRVCDERDIPTKLITINYNGQIQESYE